MDRDENAAINICREGLRISGIILEKSEKASKKDISQKEPWDTRGSLVNALPNGESNEKPHFKRELSGGPK